MKRAQNTQVLSFDIITLTKKYSTVNYSSKLWFKRTFIYYGKSMVLLKTMELRFAKEKDIVDYQKLRHFHLYFKNLQYFTERIEVFEQIYSFRTLYHGTIEKKNYGTMEKSMVLYREL